MDLFAPPTLEELNFRHSARSQKRQALYDTLKLGDRVRVKDSRKRMSGKIIYKDASFNGQGNYVHRAIVVRFGPIRGTCHYYPEQLIKVTDD